LIRLIDDRDAIRVHFQGPIQKIFGRQRKKHFRLQTGQPFGGGDVDVP
jgi:hypothetical protein